MGLIEESLRETFARQATTAPAIEDAAGRAITAAGRIRRRRHALAVAAVATSVALVGLGVVTIAGGPGAGPDVVAGRTTATAESLLPVDVLAGQSIVRADGLIIPLLGLAQPVRLWRVQSGWLVQTWDQDASLAAAWYVDEQGASRLLIAGDQVVIGRGSFNGPRVAWTLGDQLWFATFADGRLDERVNTGGLNGFVPMAIVGTGVLLGGPNAAHDMWFPAQGAYEVGPVRHDPYLGESGDRSAFYAVASEDRSCLTKVNPVGLERLRTVCGLELAGARAAYASPATPWLAVLVADRVDIYHVTSVWTYPKAQASWPVTGTGVAWLDDGTFVVGAAGKVVHLDLNDPYTRSETTVPGAGAALVQPAEDLRF